jgi:competence protein ComEC
VSRSLGHRAPLLWLVLPYMAGIVLGRCVPWLSAVPMLLIAATAAGYAIVAVRRDGRGTAIAIVTALLAAGCASYALHRHRLADWDALPPRELRLTLRVNRVFPRAEGKGVAGLATIVRTDAAELCGQAVYFSARPSAGVAPPIRSAILTCTGVLTPLAPTPPPDSFDRYLADAGMNFRLDRGRILAVEREANAYYRFLERAAARLNAWLSLGIEAKRPDLAAIYRAMMLGQKHELTEDQKTAFMESGTMHLFAINGLHIGVVALSLHALFALLRCPRPAAALLTLAVLWFDVDTTGASPSAVRAFILVAACEAAFVLRRPANGLAALSAAALGVLVLDPMALFSASFQMSYGVVLTILCFGLPLADRLLERLRPFRDLPFVTWSRPQRLWAGFLRKLWPTVGIGVAAGLVSAISGPAFFQTFAPVGFFANLILVPLAMLVIVAGFAAILTAAVGATVVGNLFNHAALVLLQTITTAIRTSTSVPAAWTAAHWRADGLASIALAVLVATVLFGYGSGWQKARGSWWPPFVVTAIAVTLGVRFG